MCVFGQKSIILEAGLTGPAGLPFLNQINILAFRCYEETPGLVIQTKKVLSDIEIGEK
jgi:hypothetical protein